MITYRISPALTHLHRGRSLHKTSAQVPCNRERTALRVAMRRCRAPVGPMAAVVVLPNPCAGNSHLRLTSKRFDVRLEALTIRSTLNCGAVQRDRAFV